MQTGVPALFDERYTYKYIFSWKIQSKLSNIRLLPSVTKAFYRNSMCRMYLIRCNNILVAKFIFVTKSSQENAQWNVTIPKTEIMLVFVIDYKIGLFKILNF